MFDINFNENKFPTFSKYLQKGFLRILGSSGHTILCFRYHPEKNPEKTETVFSLSWPSDINDGIIITATMNNEELLSCLLKKVKLYFSHPEIGSLLQGAERFMQFKKFYSAQPRSSNPLFETTHPRITLLGDAMHPMTTHRGLGANTALADAKDLAQALQEPDWQTAINKYNETVFLRGFENVKASLQSTTMIHTTRKLTRNWILWTIGRLLKIIARTRQIPILSRTFGFFFHPVVGLYNFFSQFFKKSS